MPVNLSTDVSLLVLIIGSAVLLLSLYFAARFISGKRQYDTAERIRKYFINTACPRSELAPCLRELPLDSRSLRTGTPQEGGTLCPEEWVEREAEEMNSPYYLRTGQQVSTHAAIGQAGSWYGPEAWIRDLLARGDVLLYLAGVKSETGETKAP